MEAGGQTASRESKNLPFDSGALSQSSAKCGRSGRGNWSAHRRDSFSPAHYSESHKRCEVPKCGSLWDSNSAITHFVPRSNETLRRSTARKAIRPPSTCSRSCFPPRPIGLAYWRNAVEEVNYRRFFGFNELVALRIEDSAGISRQSRANI